MGGSFGLFPNLLRQIFGKQSTALYGVLFTANGMASLAIISLIFSPIGDSYFILFYIFGVVCFIAVCILLFCFKQYRFEPDWAEVFKGDTRFQEDLVRDSQKSAHKIK